MTEMAYESLADRMRLAAEKAGAEAGASIDNLADIARGLDMDATAGKLSSTGNRLRSEAFALIVMGRFKNGKSSLLNALLGGTTVPVDLDGQHGPMVVDDLPATATLTGVRFAETPYIKAWGLDNKAETWTLKRYLAESTLEGDDRENERRFAQIREFEMGFPARLCEAGVVVYDSPGLDEANSRTAVTHEATKRCDAAIIVYRSDALMGQTELMDLDRVVADGTRVFTVINLMYGRTVDDRLRGFIWNRYVRDHLNGPDWDHQDLSERDIYFVDAGKAREGVYAGRQDLFEESGMALFERRLGEFLINERQAVHLGKFARQADNLASSIEQHIAQRQFALKADQEHLREAAELARPKLDGLRARADRLAPIIDRHRHDAQIAVANSWTEAISEIREQVPAHLMETPLPSGSKLHKVVLKRNLQREADEVINRFVRDRVAKWAENTVPEVIKPVLERMGDDVAAEITQLTRQLDAINFELTGWTPDDMTYRGKVVSAGERVLAAAAGLLFGDVSAALTGGAGGWRGAVGGISGAIGSVVLLSALGATSAAVFWPVTLGVALASGVLSGGTAIETKVKKAALSSADVQLEAMGRDVAPAVTEELARQFGDFSSTVTDEVEAVIADEIRNIEEIIDINERDQDERDRILKSLEDATDQVASIRSELQQTMATARQVA